ncbi:MAG: serine/threonine-protein kinase [Gammaproteobacteria bacterium]|nr:serine/threonine-protein kinase [Gammaproteobacteria bacterium]
MSGKGGFWTSDWFFGLVFSLLFFLLAYGIYAEAFSRMETASYDMGMRMSGAAPSDRIAVIEIDDASIELIGRWPWPRSVHADMIDKLAAGGAKVIGSTVLFSEAQSDPGLQYIDDLARFYDSSALGAEAPLPEPEPVEDMPADDMAIAAGEEAVTGEDMPAEADQPETTRPAAADEERLADAAEGDVLGDGDIPAIIYQTPEEVVSALLELRIRMATADDVLDTDKQLAASIANAGNVILPMTLTEPNPIGRPDAELQPWLLANAIMNVSASELAVDPLSYGAIQPPIPALAESSAGLGHILIIPDVDGALRFEPLAVQYDGLLFPSFSLAVAAQSLNLTPGDMEVVLGRGVNLGNLQIGTTPELLMYNYYYASDNKDSFDHYSFTDVWQGVVPVERFKDKIVLIGATALGVGDSFPTPVAPNMAPVTTVAHTISAILKEDFFTRPDWALYAELGTFLLLALYLIAILPRLRPGMAALASLGLLVAILVAEFSLLTGSSMWLRLTVPVMFLVSGHLLITIKQFRVTDRIRLKSEAEGAESNKMLGLAFQQQGQLDMAFDKFRKCPMDDSVMDALYNLALDYERKRQFNKAGSVYSHMAEHNPNYKDLQKRMKRSQAMEETIMLGGSSGGHPGGTLMLDGDEMQKPMLGRYQVEQELGKGAMGIVYGGRDPKINRVVAIKTMALSQEFEADELDEVKERFFREAETAGRLNHPYIVTIYDAGEEHDLAYIAMEFLKGKDLVPHTKADNLLPARQVCDMMANAAEALAYAHSNGVVHRDIKPANIMYNPEDKSMKLTDFGIARITDSSKTKTGMVLGTPSYMSPEQLAGQKVDGRSDLFSLGVTFYQLLSGQLPFRADSMAALMYKITNEEHAPVSLVQPDLPACLDAIINKALDKNVDNRYQNGNEMAAEIRACAGQLPG